ncbi:MAG TPA: 16S rRNA (adenine(1518)-N(6)/adenine(1519)-N(6))-dimethyltransferase RsmA [Verrucomicrobiae bacterium]|nr:16S rRNA (adenine(1518)-N(6)/adenine(1519)-N(6))-dimethyltransferase RsmA [Verrucomicrobiae bacterium]
MTLPRPKKMFGQNFLTDRNVLARIVSASGAGPADRVLEIGPGRGALTNLLAQAAGRVVAVEVDRELAALLRAEFFSLPKVEILEADVLEVDLRELLQGEGPPWKVVANLPYNISTPALFRLLEAREVLADMTLMLQKEVGARLAASPGTAEYGILSVLFGLHYDISLAFVVKPGAFFPRPKVDSAVIRFLPLQKPREEVGDEELFRRLVKAAFGQRRKTLWNCLKGAGLAPEEKLRGVLEACGIDPGRRGETLSIAEFAALSRLLAEG